MHGLWEDYDCVKCLIVIGFSRKSRGPSWVSCLIIYKNYKFARSSGCTEEQRPWRNEAGDAASLIRSVS